MPAASGRQTLNRDAVLRAGIELADDEGLDAVTMRRLAQRLDVVAMALYKHVSDKEDLLDGMVEVLLHDMPRPSPHRPNQWRAAVREAVQGARAVIVAHPWARRVIETRTVRSPAVLDHMERISQLFLRGRCSPDLTHHVMHLLGNRIWGFSPELFNPVPNSAPRRSAAAAPNPADYPGILAITADAQARRPGGAGCDEDFEFDFALDVLLDAVARLKRSAWSSPR